MEVSRLEDYLAYEWHRVVEEQSAGVVLAKRRVSCGGSITRNVLRKKMSAQTSLRKEELEVTSGER